MYFHEKFTFHLKNGIAVVMFSWLVPTTTVRYLNTIATEEINHDLLLFAFTKHFFSKWSTINELRTYSILENRMLMTLWEYKIVLLIISIFTRLFMKVLTYFQEAARRGALPKCYIKHHWNCFYHYDHKLNTDININISKSSFSLVYSKISFWMLTRPLGWSRVDDNIS